LAEWHGVQLDGPVKSLREAAPWVGQKPGSARWSSVESCARKSGEAEASSKTAKSQEA
jgi:hypothetical protein